LVVLPELGIALPTSTPAGPRHTLAYLESCTDAAASSGASTILLAGRHGPTAQFQVAPLVPLLATRAPGVTIAPLFIAPVWPVGLLTEHVITVATLAEAAGSSVVPVLASGRQEPVATSVGSPDRGRGDATDESLSILTELGFKPWMAAERGPAMRRAARADGWISNAVYDDTELAQQLSVVSAVPIRAVRRDVMCRLDGEKAQADAETALERGYRQGMRIEHVIAGDSRACAEAIAHYGETGFTHVLMRPMDADPDAAAESIAAVFDAFADLASTGGR
jgi:hypothetical protein